MFLSSVEINSVNSNLGWVTMILAVVTGSYGSDQNGVYILTPNFYI